MTLTTGSRVGAYEIVSALGAGGMGEVYRATDTNLGRDVAIKVLPDTFANDADRLARFEREARVLASLNHPNIAGIYGLERSGGSAFLVMELAAGESLDRGIARGRIPVDDAIAIARQIAEALEAAHDKGIVHRDLKPANVVVSPEGKVKVLDFGLAKLADGGSGVRPGDLSMSPTMAHAGTIAGVILGTAAYMSPEQARGRTVDKRADLWAFGCVLFEMLTGTPAFPGDTLTDIVAAVVTNEPDWKALPAATPSVVRGVLKRCLAKDPARRLRDIADARIEMEEPAYTSAPLIQPAAGAALQRRWMDALPWAIVAVALIIAGTILFRARPGADAPGSIARLELSPPAGVELYAGGGPLAIAHDGQTIAFIGVRGGVRQIYLRRLDQFDATPLRGTEGAFSCFFSPAGDAIGFTGMNGSLRKILLADGLVVTVSPSGTDNIGRQVWGFDDAITFNRGTTLWRVPAAGGTARVLTTLDRDSGDLAHAYPAAGRTSVLFTSLSATRPPRIEAVDPSTGVRRVVLESATYAMPAPELGRLVFFRDEALYAVPFDDQKLSVTGIPVRVVERVGVGSTGGPLTAVSASGTLVYSMTTSTSSTLTWVTRRGEQRPVTTVPRPYYGPRLSPDGHRIVVQAGTDLWIHDPERSTFTRLTSSATFGNSFPIWTPDGKRVVFRTLTGIHTIDIDRETAPVRIPDTTSGDFPTSVSPDGQTLLVVRQGGPALGSQDVFAIPLNGDGPARPIVSTPAYEGGGVFSPDGRWIAYVSDDSGQMQVYVRSALAERRWQISTDGGTSPLWNRNGREIFYRNGNKFMAVDITSGTDLALAPPRPLFEHPFTFGATITIPNYDVSPDGQRFVMVQDQPGAGRLAVVLNWFDDLRRTGKAQ